MTSADLVWCRVILHEIFTAEPMTGAKIRAGHWYLSVDQELGGKGSARFPDNGYLKLSTGETFRPTSHPPLIYTAAVDSSATREFCFRLKVLKKGFFGSVTEMTKIVAMPIPFGADTGKTPEEKYKLPVSRPEAPGDIFELVSNDGKVRVKISVHSNPMSSESAL